MELPKQEFKLVWRRLLGERSMVKKMMTKTILFSC